MQHQHFTTTLLVDQSPEEAFNAITNVRGWWSGFWDEIIEGDSHQLDDEFTFRVKDVHYSRQKLIELVPGKKLVWLVTDSELSFLKNKSEWTGTKLIFDISRKDDKTRIIFTHQGLVPEVECYNACAPAWTQYVQETLFRLISAGKVTSTR